MMRTLCAIASYSCLSVLLLSCSASTSSTYEKVSETEHSHGNESRTVMTDEGDELEVQRALGNYKRFESAEELEQISDLIVIGKPEVSIDESISSNVSEKESKSKKKSGKNSSESFVVRDEEGVLLDGFTITPFKVQKYVKGELDSKSVDVLQPAAMVSEEGKEPFLWKVSGYSPLSKKSKYLLFLKQVDAETYPNLKDVYSIVSVSQGKYNFDNTDSAETELENDDSQFRQLKSKVKEKYKKKYDSTP